MVLILYALIHNVFLKKIARREVGQIKSGKVKTAKGLGIKTNKKRKLKKADTNKC